MAKQSLDQWIREILTDQEIAKRFGKCTRLALVHIAGRDAEVYTVSIAGKQWDPKELADLFYDKADNHCAELPGHQTYNLLAFFEDRQEAQGGRKQFARQGGLNNLEDSQYMTEPPDAKGLVGQTMRHNEAFAKITLAHTSAMVDSCTRMVNQLSVMLTGQMNENREMFTLLRESAMKQITDNNEHELKKIKLNAGLELRATVAKLLPEFVNSFTGKEIFPQKMADSAIIEKMAEELSESDLVLLQQMLRPELMGLLSKRMTRIIEDKNKARQQAEAAMNGKDVEEAEFSSAITTTTTQ